LPAVLNGKLDDVRATRDPGRFGHRQDFFEATAKAPSLQMTGLAAFLAFVFGFPF
jgi:hypothetical protein